MILLAQIIPYRVLTINSTSTTIQTKGGTMDFPLRLRTLRREAGLSQRGLAERVNVDFTYLSKIENGRVEPPSETVLKNISAVLAEELELDAMELSDELITLAGKIPSDLAETLARNPGAVRFLRSLGDEVRSADEWQRLIQEQETGYRVDSGRGGIVR